MKRIVLGLAFFVMAVAGKAQSAAPKTPEKNKVHYSFAWGLLKSKDYPKDKRVVWDFRRPEFSTSSTPAPDDEKVEEKSILWGVIKWTEKKKSASPLNNR